MTKKSKESKQRVIRCAIYTRKSCEEGLDQDFNSLHAQRESAESFIKSQQNEGWICIPDQYDDGGYSGGSIHRPALEQLIADIKAGKIDCVIVYKVDRLSRSLLDFAQLMALFEEFDVSFVSVTQQFNTTHSMGRLTLNILLSFAQFEREIIGERIRDKLAALCRKGKWIGGHPVLGYEVDRTNPSPKLVVNAEEASQVREIFQLYLQHQTLTPVLMEINNRGWINKSWTTRKGVRRGGRIFDKNALHFILTNSLYIGRIKYKELSFDGEHEAIIDAETFEQVGALLKSHNHGKGNRAKNRYKALLKGLVCCAACNAAMVHRSARRRTKVYRFYSCVNAIHRGKRECPSPNLPAAQVEQAVIKEICTTFGDCRFMDEVIQQAKAKTQNRIAELMTQKRQFSRQLTRDTAEIQGIESMSLSINEATAERIDFLRGRSEKSRKQLERVERELTELESNRLNPGEVKSAFHKFESIWAGLTHFEQLQLIRLFVKGVVFDPSDCSIAVTFHTLEEYATAESCVL